MDVDGEEGEERRSSRDPDRVRKSKSKKSKSRRERATEDDGEAAVDGEVERRERAPWELDDPEPVTVV